jgi:hypothetical protein
MTWIPSRWARLRVDVAQTSFFTGRQFRTTRRITLAAGASYTIKWSRAADVVVLGLGLQSSAGTIRLNMYRGGTPSGAFTDTIPVFDKNETADKPTPTYTTQSALTGGAVTVSGGEFRDAVDAVASGATAQASTVGGQIADEVGYPADTVGYYVFTNDGNGPASGIFRLHWEERA